MVPFPVSLFGFVSGTMKLKTERGLALSDLISETVAYVLRIKFMPTVRAAVLQRLADLEYANVSSAHACVDAAVVCGLGCHGCCFLTYRVFVAHGTRRR